ncbi:MAG: 5'-deoxynucleotidase [Lachnospiraceae bacterium]|nr:5'-deoxynucleotidase [Lachnospiraceae bacterium]
MGKDESNFCAMMSRMKYIDRWALMRNSWTENICEHSLEVAMIAHMLCVIGNKRFGKNLDASKAALIGMYHDTTEIITGDMPTPVKYYNDTIQTVFHKIEDAAAETLLTMLPEDLREEFYSLYFKQEEDAYLWKLVKAADKFSALIKCMEEKKAGNKEFDSAFKSTKASIIALELPEADCFMEEFIPAYNKNLDELQKR